MSENVEKPTENKVVQKEKSKDSLVLPSLALTPNSSPMKDDAIREKLSPREKIMKMLTVTKHEIKEATHHSPRSPRVEKEKSPRSDKSPRKDADRVENKSPFKDRNKENKDNRARSKTEGSEKKSNSLSNDVKNDLNMKNQKAAQWRLSKRDSTQPNQKTETEATHNAYSSSIIERPNEFLAMCLIENRKAIQLFKNEFKSSDVQALQKLLLEQFNFRQQIIQADEKNNEKMISFREDNLKTAQELEDFKLATKKAFYESVQRANAVSKHKQMAEALFIVARHYSIKMYRNISFLSLLKHEINQQLTLREEIEKKKTERRNFLAIQQTGLDSSDENDPTQISNNSASHLVTSSALSLSAKGPARNPSFTSSHSQAQLRVSAATAISTSGEVPLDGKQKEDLLKESIRETLELRLNELPDVKPDPTVTISLEFADLIGINLEEYMVMREQSLQQQQQQKNLNDLDSNSQRRDPTPIEPSGLLSGMRQSPVDKNKKPGGTKERKDSTGPKATKLSFLQFGDKKKDKGKTKK